MKNLLHFVTFLISLCLWKHLYFMGQEWGWKSLVTAQCFSQLQPRSGEECVIKVRTPQPGLPEAGESVF